MAICFGSLHIFRSLFFVFQPPFFNFILHLFLPWAILFSFCCKRSNDKSGYFMHLHTELHTWVCGTFASQTFRAYNIVTIGVEFQKQCGRQVIAEWETSYRCHLVAHPIF